MDINGNGFKRKKKTDITRWLSGRNTAIYLIILLLLLTALVFALKTIIGMHEQNEENENTVATEIETETKEKITVATTTYVAPNQLYLIKINKADKVLVVYKLDTDKNVVGVEKAFYVAIGKDVATGTTQISEKSIWKQNSSYSFCHYASRLSNAEYLYSASYYTADVYNLNPSSYNSIGTIVSEGSVFMTATNAKWIYENCGVNTTVEILDSLDMTGITVETFAKVSSDAYMDPLDNKTITTK